MDLLLHIVLHYMLALVAGVYQPVEISLVFLDSFTKIGTILYVGL